MDSGIGQSSSRLADLEQRLGFMEERCEERMGTMERLLRQLVDQHVGPSSSQAAGTTSTSTSNHVPRTPREEPQTGKVQKRRGRPPGKRMAVKKEPIETLIYTQAGKEVIVISDDEGEAPRPVTRLTQPKGGRSASVKVDVTISTPDGPKRKRFLVTMGQQKAFDMGGLGLQPSIDVDPDYNRGFRRSTIKKVLHGHQSWNFHNWDSSSANGDYAPFLTMPRDRHPHLPTHPGGHGLILPDLRVFNDQTPVNRDIPLFVGCGTNDWRLMGTYNVVQWCEVQPSHVARLPARMLDSWVKAYDYERGGHDWIESANAILMRTRPKRPLIERTHACIKEALLDGRLSLTFTVLECVGYPYAWFDELVEMEGEELAMARLKQEDDERTLVGSQGTTSSYYW